MRKNDLGKIAFSANATQNAINENDMSISFIALSKDNIHKRTDVFGNEYFLSVDTSKVSFNAQNLYLDHDVSFENAVGVITESKFENGDFKVRVKFDESVERSREAFNAFKAGLSKSVSVGFSDYDITPLPDIDGIPHFEIQKGEIYELSAVWQGADPNAKIANFSKQTNQTKGEQMSENITQKEVAQTAPVTNEPQVELSKDNQNMIIELGKIAGAESKALDAIASGKSYAQFAAELRASKEQEKYQSVAFAKKELKDEPKNFSLANVIKSVDNPSIDLGFENGFMGSNGFALPNEFYAKFANEIKTASQEAIIETAYRGDLFISKLREESGLLDRCTWLGGLSSKVDIPRDNSNIQAQFVDEGNSADNQITSFDRINLAPNTLAVKVTISRRMLIMSAIDLENYVYSAMRHAIRKKLEETLLYGKTPIKGIFETAGISAVNAYIDNASLSSTLEFSNKLYEADLSTDNAIFVMNGISANALRAVAREQGTERKLLE